jgi:benzodiazapine receptor
MIRLMKKWVDRVGREAGVYRAMLRHPRTPKLSKVLLSAALAYLVSPIDIIPDFIPVLGLLDDILIVPLLVWLALAMIPKEVKRECRSQVHTTSAAETGVPEGKPTVVARRIPAWGACTLSILICLSAGAIGSVFTRNSVNTWYASLNKPLFNPPAWLFAPVWTALYVMMGISAFLVWKTSGSNRRRALRFFALQLTVNTLWSVVFFGLHSIKGGLAIIIVLLVLILATIAGFSRISKPAATLLVPYLAWVLFATALNASFLMLNLP